MTTIHATAPAAPVKFYNHLYFRVLVGMFAGIVVGHFWPDVGASLKPLGDAFVKIVKMMIAPVVFCTIVSGITSMSDNREIAKTLIKAMGLFYALTITALVIGFAISLFQSVTQIQEATLSFVPKAIGVGAAILFSGNWMLHEMVTFTTQLFERIPTLLG